MIRKYWQPYRKLLGYVVEGKYYPIKEFKGHLEFLLFINRKPCKGYTMIFKLPTKEKSYIVGESRPDVIHSLLDDAYLETASFKRVQELYKHIGLELKEK